MYIDWTDRCRRITPPRHTAWRYAWASTVELRHRANFNSTPCKRAFARRGIVYAYTAKSESPGDHAPVPTEEPNKVSTTPTKSDPLDTQERGFPEVERTGVDERGAGPSHSCRAPPAGPPRVHSRQVPKDPRVHMGPALAATKCSYHITWKPNRLWSKSDIVRVNTCRFLQEPSMCPS